MCLTVNVRGGESSSQLMIDEGVLVALLSAYDKITPLYSVYYVPSPIRCFAMNNTISDARGLRDVIQILQRIYENKKTT